MFISFEPALGASLVSSVNELWYDDRPQVGESLLSLVCQLSRGLVTGKLSEFPLLFTIHALPLAFDWTAMAFGGDRPELLE